MMLHDGIDGHPVDDFLLPNTPDLEPDALKLGRRTLARADRAQWLVVEGDAARGGSIRERLVQPQPV